MEAEIHQANTVPDEYLMQLQSYIRPYGEETNRISIYLEAAQELYHIT